jgi:hypothetical protein
MQDFNHTYQGHDQCHLGAGPRPGERLVSHMGATYSICINMVPGARFNVIVIKRK